MYEPLVQLAYELLDAHDDTARLAVGLPLDARWAAHLDYLRDLQRVGRETLAHIAAGECVTGQHAGVEPEVATPLAAFDRAGIRWCLLRGEPVARPGGDVDLLVHPGDLPTVRQVLTAEGTFAEVQGWGRGAHHFFVDRVPGEHGSLKLDVVTELAFGRYGELRSDVADSVLRRTVRDGAIARPAPDDGFWALLLHVLLDRGDVSRDHARQLESLADLARGRESPLRSLIDHACPPGWDAARIADVVAAGRFEAVLAIAPALRASWPGAPRSATAARAFLRRGLRYVDRRRPRRRVLDERALAVARRADWRFLLPEPALGRVAYLAPQEADLVAALELVAGRLDVLEPAAPAGADHELVVVTAGRAARSALEARALLCPRGRLYAEVPGRRVRSWTRELRKAGFDDVDAHWLWPDARGCREIVPFEPEAIRAMLDRRDPGARLRLRARATSLLVRAGLFRFAVRRAAVIGTWSG
jgi:hypothetical protein